MPSVPKDPECHVAWSPSVVIGVTNGGELGRRCLDVLLIELAVNSR